MRRHLLVVSEKKIKMLKTTVAPHRVKYYRWRHNIFSRTTYIHNKYICIQYLLSIFNTMGVMLRTMMQNGGHQMPDNGRRMMEAGP